MFQDNITKIIPFLKSRLAVPVLMMALVFAGSFTACKKTGPAEALITVRNAAGSPVQGARVVLRQDSVKNPTTNTQANIYQSEITNFGGEAFFSFKNEAVLNVEVSLDTFFVKDFIRLEQSNLVTKDITLK